MGSPSEKFEMKPETLPATSGREIIIINNRSKRRDFFTIFLYITEK
jgi:hypothetical protein